MQMLVKLYEYLFGTMDIQVIPYDAQLESYEENFYQTYDHSMYDHAMFDDKLE